MPRALALGIVLLSSALLAQQPTNDLPNPYTTVENHFRLPAGRTWGATSAVDVDRDGRSIWVAERCGANSCLGSDVPVVLKFDADGKLVRSFGGGMFVFPHGIHVDRDGNVWVTDGQDNVPRRRPGYVHADRLQLCRDGRLPRHRCRATPRGCHSSRGSTRRSVRSRHAGECLLMQGDFTPGKVVRLGFNTHKADGTPITLAGTPAVKVWKDANTTESTSGVTLTVDFDSLTGSHLVTIDTSADGTFYATGSDFRAVLTAGTVDSISVVGSA